MPAFIKTPADEKRWSKAKQAANKTHSESEGDSYWALVNSIYQKMTKSEDIEAVKAVLVKARRRLSDEPEEDPEDVSPEEMGMREFDPDTEEDDADKWLAENDPERGKEEEDEPTDEYEEYAPEEDEEAHQRDSEFLDEPEEPSEEPAAEAETPEEEGTGEGDPVEEPDEEVAAQEEPVRQQAAPGEGRFPQPSREEIAEMRQHTRPLEQRAREMTRLGAEAEKNPVLAHEGRIVEARNMSHRDHQDAYAKMQASPDYQNADPVTQMEMDSKFEADWHKQHPDYLANAAKAHAAAHVEGLKGMGEGARAKKEAIQHVRTGGAQAEEPMSAEEAMQHAGGVKDEEGTTGSMVQDPATRFAREHQQFLSEEGERHEGRAAAREGFYGRKAQEYAGKHGAMPEHKRGSVQDILGEASKDPKVQAKFNEFFGKYHPMIEMNAHRVLNALGLDKRNIDMGMLHEAGMHGIIQAINDYEHDNPAKASFSTHAGNKMRGLMQTALRDQQNVPLQTEAKKYNLQQIVGTHPPEVADRMKRINTFKQVQTPKVPKVPESGGEGGMNG